MRWDAWFQAQDEPPIPAQIRPSLNTNLKAATTAYDYCTHQQPGGAFGHHNPCPGGHRQGSAVRRQDGGSPGLLRRRGFGLRESGTNADSSPGFADADSEWDGLRFSSEYQLARMAAEPHGPGRALGHHRAPFPPKIPLPGSDSRT